MPHEQPWLDKEPKYVMPRKESIRGICITDCTAEDDYKKIVWLCEADLQHLHWLDIQKTTAMEWHPKRLLYDDGDTIGFMHQWSAQETDKEWFEEYKKTLQCMTVMEFYRKYAPQFIGDKVD